MVTAAPVLQVNGRRVLITGHTGFKGSWLAEWMLQRGARVSGIALPPDSGNSLFDRLRLGQRLNHAICDINDANALAAAVRRADPEIVFHLAAQALVRRSYREPLLTWRTNVQGTLNVLEAARALGRRITVVVVTTDKVYRNREWDFAYREVDELGGHDPYSASKAAAEIAVASWRASFAESAQVAVATARAGNVLGAGDLSEDRIVPDCFRAWRTGRRVEIRHPGSTRPWQHVLEPLSGYMALAANLESGGAVLDTCNFGPGSDGNQTVETLVSRLSKLGSARDWVVTGAPQEHEARALSLSIDRARHRLSWAPRLSFDEMVAWTNDGYTETSGPITQLIERQIADFESLQR